ncbi:HNH endonuclease [Pseudomonas brassicacearum]|uniref:HNH endonuclease n=1 Tax=Pseudomonas brassicacearum TaxID=930166 RepID=A0A423HRY6_9PSED|nr:HNH endonuclease [Pseudomonas brassicacearum]RON15936.1 HNH endonuclease [Pseudomonas brassicacearum]
MAITEKSIKLLWSNAAGRCSFTDCDERLTVEQAASSAPHTLGEMAHIKGKNTGSNRYDEHQTDMQRDGYENLILLCPNHHTLIDKAENEEKYSVEMLLEMKILHEACISSRLTSVNITNIEDLKTEISICLAENRQAWLQYGPLSENAQKSPNNEKLYALWLSERLTTIVPNNRVVTKLINKHRKLFHRSNQHIISQFLSHATSYEKWVNDEVPYQAVLRFPIEFENLIMEG